MPHKDLERRREARRKSQRKHRKKYAERWPLKYAARQKVSAAIRYGRLIRKPCEVCGNQKSQAHHDDYSKPLDVRWLCRDHHSEIKTEYSPFTLSWTAIRATVAREKA